MNARPPRRQWSTPVSVAIAVVAAAFLFFEIIRSQLPGPVQAAVERSEWPTAWVVAAAIGLSLLCSGIGVVSISSVRLMLALRKADVSLVNAAAKDQLGCTAMVVVGFVLTVSTALMLSQIKL